MIITDKFIYTHLPHTAGGFVTRFLVAALTPAPIRHMRKHFPVSELDFRLDRPLIGTIRNPWAWYVGTHHYRKKNGIVRVEGFDPRVKSFKDCTIAFLENDVSASMGVGVYTERYMRWFCQDYAEIRATPEGIERFLADPGRFSSLTYALPVERNLTLQLLDTLDDLGIELSEERRRMLRSMDKVNESRHGHYSQYYDDELREMIAEKDRAIIALDGYSFETA